MFDTGVHGNGVLLENRRCPMHANSSNAVDEGALTRLWKP